MLELRIDYADDLYVVEFEHSLLALSKWESIYKKSFLSSKELTADELLDYYSCMIVTPDVPPEVVYGLSPDQMDKLHKYIIEERTASVVNDHRLGDTPKSSEVVTSELIYFWLSSLKIPFHPTETWHLSRLLILVRTANYKNTPPDKKDARKIQADWRTINAQRLAKYNTTG